MSSELDLHLEEAKYHTANAVKNVWTAAIGTSVIMAAAVTVGDVINRSPIPLINESTKEAVAEAIEGLGIIGGGAFVVLGVGSAAVVGARAAYHQFKVHQIQRKEAIINSYENIFYWPIAPNNSHLNGNL